MTITTEPGTETQLELVQLQRETPAQVEPVQARAPAPVPHKLKLEKKTQQRPRGAAMMDDGNHCRVTDKNIITSQDGARVLRPRTAAAFYQATEPDDETTMKKIIGMFSTLTDFVGVLIKMNEEQSQKPHKRVNDPSVVMNDTPRECYETQEYYYDTVERHDTAPTDTQLYGPTRTREGEI